MRFLINMITSELIGGNLRNNLAVVKSLDMGHRAREIWGGE